MLDTINAALEGQKRHTKRAVSRKKLDELPIWRKSGRESYMAVKKALEKSVETAYFDPNLEVCVFADASDNFWGLILTQCKSEELQKPIRECHHLRSGYNRTSGDDTIFRISK